MSNVVDFMFNNLGRIGNDDYSYTQSNIMNNAQSSYMLTNVHGSNDKQASILSTQFPTMNIKGTSQVGPLGYNVDEKSKLMNSKLTNLNCKISLQERSYKTVPYLGRGNVDVGLENSLRLGDTLTPKEECCTIKREVSTRCTKVSYAKGC